MNYLSGLLLAATALFFANTPLAHSTKNEAFEINHPFSTPKPPRAPTGAVFFDLINHGDQPLRLISARSEISNHTELHDMTMTDGVMTMRQVPFIEVAPKQTLSMRPGGGYHVMLIGLTKTLVEGERFPVWLTFENHAEVEIDVWIEKTDQGANMEHMHHKEHQH